jgi:hypothetical protein
VSQFLWRYEPVSLGASIFAYLPRAGADNPNLALGAVSKGKAVDAGNAMSELFVASWY